MWLTFACAFAIQNRIESFALQSPTQNPHINKYVWIKWFTKSLRRYGLDRQYHRHPPTPQKKKKNTQLFGCHVAFTCAVHSDGAIQRGENGGARGWSNPQFNKITIWNSQSENRSDSGEAWKKTKLNIISNNHVLKEIILRLLEVRRKMSDPC